MKKAYCLLNHTLTENQIKDLYEEWGIQEIIYPQEQLSVKWSQIAPGKTLDYGLIYEVCSWLAGAEKEDVIVVQGEYGSTFCIVDYSLKNGLVPVHAVTKRVATEMREGEIVTRKYIFEHCCFRKYEYFYEKCEISKQN